MPSADFTCGLGDAKFYTTGACFTRRWLKTDVLQSLILPDPMVCIKPSKPLLRKFVVSAPHQSTKSACFSNAERLTGYWLNNTWVAGACEGVDMTQAVRAKKQYIYVWGQCRSWHDGHFLSQDQRNQIPSNFGRESQSSFQALL